MKFYYEPTTMDNAIGIGSFQFDNLIRNRVPFALFVKNCDFSTLYRGLDLDHIHRYSLNYENPIESLKEKKYRKIDPVLFICEDGSDSQKKANELAEAGYVNCFFVANGFLALRGSDRE